MKIVFLGTPDYAVKSLEALYASRHDVMLVITQPDRPANRGKKLQEPAVKIYAKNNNINYIQTSSISKDSELINKLKELSPDLLITSAFGQLLSQEVIDIAKHGVWNLHASILPRWRGAAPIQWSLIEGDEYTGITVMQTDIGLDTGDILAIQEYKILSEDNSQTLLDKLAVISGEILLDCINKFEQGDITPIKQDESHTTYAKKIKKDMSNINWQQDTCQNILNKLQAFTPFMYMRFEFGDNNYIKVIKASDTGEIIVQTEFEPGEIIEVNKSGIQVQTSDNKILCIEEVQPPNKKPMSAYNWYSNLKEKPLSL